MSTVSDLLPGDQVTAGIEGATFVARAQHPIWPHLQLVIWKMPDGSWSHDALDLRQHVGDIRPSTYDQRQERLFAALLPGRGEHP